MPEPAESVLATRNATNVDAAGLLFKALAFASEKHRNQRRKDADASPYINHPIALANVLANEAGVNDTDVLCAAILHDTVEDTETSYDELVSTFGLKIADIVMEVTDDKSLHWTERKEAQVNHAPHISREAKLVKLADKICNLRDMLACPPANWKIERRVAYFHWAARVVEGMRGTNASMETIFDALFSQHEGMT